MRLTGGKAAANRAGLRPQVNRSFERKLAQLESMSGHMLDASDIDRLRKALGHANNYLVSKAARLVTDNVLVDLLPEVLEAWERFFIDPIASDPQCWAKTALAKALVKLDCREAAVYLRGLKHTQEEPVWGGQSDTAGALRATCTHALVVCEGLSQTEMLDILLFPLVDRDKTVRMEAVRAIGHIGGPSAALLLKMRILLRKEEPEVLGAAFSALLGMDSSDKAAAIPLIADFLYDGEEAAGEAAFALAETHLPGALASLIEHRGKDSDPWFASVLDHAIVLSRLPTGMDFLLGLIENDPRQAGSVIEAISRVHNSEEIRARIAAAVKRSKSDRSLATFHQYFPEAATGD